jgi:two-component system, LytTR family, sensor kinase
MSFDLSNGTHLIKRMICEFAILFVWAASAFYSMYFYGYRFFEKGSYLKYAISCLSVAAICTAVFYSIVVSFINISGNTAEIPGIAPPFFGTLVLANCGSLLRGFVNWIELANRQSQLEKSSLQHELESLRSQMNPHFLFNTLNNIDSLIFSAPGRASDSLLKLSGILRYMLYDTKGKTVDLLMEIEHLENLVALQSLRFSNPSYVRFAYSGCSNNAAIAPLLFTPFVENAFKFASGTGPVPVIDIVISCSKDTVVFQCSNSYSPDRNAAANCAGGIGLSNVKRRLELIYPRQHSLHITDTEHIFNVILTINTGRS